MPAKIPANTKPLKAPPIKDVGVGGAMARLIYKKVTRDKA